MNTSSIKRQFPIFSGKNKNLIYLDSAATSQKPQRVIKAEVDWYTKLNANTHRGAYNLAEMATAAYESARETVAGFIHTKSVKEIVFTSGTTEGINLVARSWVSHSLKKGDTILLTEMEHHANIVPWQLLAQELGFKLRYWPIDKDGKLEMKNLSRLFAGVKFLSLVHISNVLGTVNPVDQIISLAKQKNIKVLVDAAQSVSHMGINVSKMKPDFLVFSSHKMLGPTGIGVIYIDSARHGEMKPYQAGGEMIGSVSYKEATFKKVPYLLEAGTQSLAQVYGLARAIEYLDGLGMKNVKKHIEDLTRYAYREMSKIKDLTIYGPKTSGRLGLISFSSAAIHAHDLTTLLDRDNIAVRAGHHCAMPLHDKLKVSSTVRASFSVYTNKSDINKLIVSLKSILKEWNKRIKE
jgi:cysteine desulfurase/selenocysteine lyase